MTKDKTLTKEEKDSHGNMLFVFANIMHKEIPFKIEKCHRDLMKKEFKKICTKVRKMNNE